MEGKETGKGKEGRGKGKEGKRHKDGRKTLPKYISGYCLGWCCFNSLSCVKCLQKHNVGAMYGAAVALVILQQPDKAKSQLRNINGITWNMQVCHSSLSPCST